MLGKKKPETSNQKKCHIHKLTLISDELGCNVYKY